MFPRPGGVAWSRNTGKRRRMRRKRWTPGEYFEIFGTWSLDASNQQRPIDWQTWRRRRSRNNLTSRDDRPRTLTRAQGRKQCFQTRTSPRTRSHRIQNHLLLNDGILGEGHFHVPNAGGSIPPFQPASILWLMTSQTQVKMQPCGTLVRPFTHFPHKPTL